MIVHRVSQGAPEWQALRVGIPTASEFDKILTPSTRKLSKQADTYMYSKLAEWLLGQPVDMASSQFMQRGSELENEARAWYEFEYNTTVEQVGFVTRDDKRVGCSPDGLIDDDGLVEIKTLSPVNHVAALLGHADDYAMQIQGQLWIAERRYCKRVYYNPAIKPVVEHVDRDEELIGQLAVAVNQFLERLDEAKEKLLAMGCVPVTPITAAQRTADDAEFDALVAETLTT